MDEDEIHQQKLAELQEMQQAEQVKKTLLQNILTKEARERLNAIRAAKPELAEQVELFLIQAAQSGQLRSNVTDEQLKHILASVQGEKKGFRILRK